MNSRQRSPSTGTLFRWLLVPALLPLLGCDRAASEATEPPHKTPQAQAAQSPAAPQGTAHGTPGTAHGTPGTAHGTPAGASGPRVGITWDMPTDWTELPARPMRQATYEALGPGGPAEIAIYYFGPGQGGDVESNITRWVAQFQGLAPGSEQRSTAVINGFTHHNVRVLKGTYSASMMGPPAAPKKNYGMNATIVETPTGSYFFKLTGPAETVSSQQESFSQLLASVRSKP